MRNNRINNRIFVVDGNWYLHRCYYTINPKHRSVEEALVYSFVSLVCKDALAVKANHLLIGFDGPSVFRYKLYPKYKANRSKESTESLPSTREGFKDVYEYLPVLLSFLTEIQFPWVQPATFEADDVLCSAAEKYKGYSDCVFCGTKDKDSYQYLTSSTWLYDSSNKVNGNPSPLIITPEKAEKIKGMPCRLMAAFQCLIGDKIDNIPTIVTPAKAKALLKRYGSVNEAVKHEDDLLSKLEALKLNAKLVTLRKDVDLPDFRSLLVKKVDLDADTRKALPHSYFSYIDFLWPKQKGLFL